MSKRKTLPGILDARGQSRCRHGTMIPDNHCEKCYDEYMVQRADEVRRSYLAPGTRVGSPTAGVAGDRRFIRNITVQTSADPVEITSMFDLGKRYIPQMSTVIKDQDGVPVPEELHDKIMSVIQNLDSEDWQVEVQTTLDWWNDHGRHWMDQEINERYSADGSERYPQMVMWV